MECLSRLVVFTGDLNYNVRRNIVDLNTRICGISWLVLVHAPRTPFVRRLANQRGNLEKHGWRWLSYQVGEQFGRITSFQENQSMKDRPGSEYGLERLNALGNVHVVRVDDLHANSSIALVEEFSPDLGIALAAPLLKHRLFRLPRLGSINLHKGKLPEFRGMPPAFWELWTDQTSVGCSVHWVEEQLDKGGVLAESSVNREHFSSLRGLQVQLDELGVKLVCEVVEAVLAGKMGARVQAIGQGKIYRKPTLEQESILAKRLLALEPRGIPVWKQLLKSSFSNIAVAAHRVLMWRLVAPRVTVLLYHRVCDDARDNLSVGIGQFERQMHLLREHCELIPIDLLLETKEIPRSRRPLVSVTFDDGYLDNYLNAVPILRRVGVPAAFFVSTGIVNSDRCFPHDIRRGNSSIPVMNWNQLREMHDWGFTIGSHTVSHIDCVAEDATTVRNELLLSRIQLAIEIGLNAFIFAYPYGGKHQMNAQRLEMVKEAGYSGCLSAFGGSNIGVVQRWCVLRRGINWEFSDASFLYQTLGY